MMSSLNDKELFLKKVAQTIEMSFDIPDSEKEIAKEAVLRFEDTMKSLQKATDHLDVIYEPFSKHKNIPTKSVVEKRGVLNRFKQASKEKFENFKYLCVLSIQKINHFANGDMEIKEIISTFESSVLNVEDEVEDFFDILGDYESEDFQEKVLESIDSIKNKAEELNDLVYDSIIDHIDTNIVGKTWMSENNSKFKIEKEEKIPMVLELYKKRQELLGNKMYAVEKEKQILNPSDAPRVYSPDSARTVNFTEFGE